MKTNYETKEILITKEENNIASNPSSELSKQITNLMAIGFKVVVKKAPRKRDAFKGLTYEYMENYINAHEANRDENLATLNKLRGIGEAFVESASYGEVKTWFLMEYPEVAQPNNDVLQLREEIRRKNAELKAIA